MPAEVLELADRHDSGSCVGNDVWVQVPSSALKINLDLSGFLLRYEEIPRDLIVQNGG